MYVYPAAIAVAFAASHASADMGTTMTNEWKYNKPIVITGDNLDGDDPYWNKLCIAPVANKENKICYDPDDSKDGLTIDKWDNNTLSFYAPADIPVNGVVILQLQRNVQHCFGSAGCNDTTEDNNLEVGSYKASPFVTELIDLTTSQKVYELKANTAYKMKGAYFGNSKGSIFLHSDKGSDEIAKDSILAWSYNEILFKTPANIEPFGLSVNNGIIATKYELSEASSPSSSAKINSSKSSSAPNQNAQADAELFNDVSSSNPYKDAIAWAKQSGILQGYPDGSFKPDRTVNRAEFLKIVLGAKGINVSDVAGSAVFKDVDDGAWYAPYIRYAKTQSIIQGYPDGTFKPDQTVNFAEALKMAYNALNVKTSDMGGNWYDRYLQHAMTNNVLYTSNVQIDGGMSRKDVVWIAWKLMTHVGDWKQPSKAVTVPPQPKTTTSALQFKDGTYIVGTDIQPGTYRTRKGTSNCYYERLKGFSGDFSEIIANNNTSAPAIVTIEASDKGFKSSGCGIWTQDLSAITTSRTSFSDGMFIIGTDIEAGTYKNSGGSSCYYERVRGFTNTLDDIIANENASAPTIVTIAPSDQGFKASRCGTWSKIQ